MSRKLSVALVVTLVVALFAVPSFAADSHRVVSLNGDFTEIMYELGLEDLLVAVDATSNYPEAANDLPNIGYHGALSVEAILAYDPTIVFANEVAGPAEVLDQLEAAGVQVVVIENEGDIMAPVRNARAVGELVGAPEAGEQLAQAIEAKIAQAGERGAALDPTPRVMFFYLGSTTMQFAGGTGAPSSAMINGVGAIDAGAEAGFVGYQPVTAEAVVEAAPDVIVITERGVNVLGSVEGIYDVPGVALTPAGEKGNILVYEDGYFINMGPRTGDALLEFVGDLESMQ